MQALHPRPSAWPACPAQYIRSLYNFFIRGGFDALDALYAYFRVQYFRRNMTVGKMRIGKVYPWRGSRIADTPHLAVTAAGKGAALDLLGRVGRRTLQAYLAPFKGGVYIRHRREQGFGIRMPRRSRHFGFHTVLADPAQVHHHYIVAQVVNHVEV